MRKHGVYRQSLSNNMKSTLLRAFNVLLQRRQPTYTCMGAASLFSVACRNARSLHDKTITFRYRFDTGPCVFASFFEFVLASHTTECPRGSVFFLLAVWKIITQHSIFCGFCERTRVSPHIRVTPFSLSTVDLGNSYAFPVWKIRRSHARGPYVRDDWLLAFSWWFSYLPHMRMERKYCFTREGEETAWKLSTANSPPKHCGGRLGFCVFCVKPMEQEFGGWNFSAHLYRLPPFMVGWLWGGKMGFVLLAHEQ